MTSKPKNISRPLYTRLALLVLLSTLFLRGASCARIERPYPPPRASEVLSALIYRGQQVKTLRAETRMTHRSSAGRVKGTVKLMARRGGKLRLDVVSPFDTPLATLVSDGSRFSLVDAQQNRHYHGPAAPCNLARLVRVVLRPDDVLTVLAGSTPIIEHQQLSLAWDERDGVEVLTLRGKQRVQTIRLDGRDRRWDMLQSEVRDLAGELELGIEASSFRQLSGLRLPASLHLSQPENNAELWLTYRQQEVNLTLPAPAFEVQPAGGLPSQRVECQSGGTPIRSGQ